MARRVYFKYNSLCSCLIYIKENFTQPNMHQGSGGNIYLYISILFSTIALYQTKCCVYQIYLYIYIYIFLLVPASPLREADLKEGVHFNQRSLNSKVPFLYSARSQIFILLFEEFDRGRKAVVLCFPSFGNDQDSVATFKKRWVFSGRKEIPTHKL